MADNQAYAALAAGSLGKFGRGVDWSRVRGRLLGVNQEGEWEGMVGGAPRGGI